jgi:hypothetical protein
LRQWLQSGTN